MNYLGHALLSFGNTEVLMGNMMADHVKGKLALEKYPAGIQKGIMLHRKIDQFTDEHAATSRAKILFKPDYGLYASPIIDCLYDHYLANDPKYFASEKELLKFSENTYEQLASQEPYFTNEFASYFPYMKLHNWLYNYRTMPGMQKSLNGLHRRAPHMPPIEIAYETFVVNYYILAQCYYEFMDDVSKFVKLELGL